ncbi:hypothetical protein BOTNAR_1255g00010 [Botryotinia narcissicola]|uniref:Uncharacterized protein n=1 Tax=Botryotinia narcissicola TaxID=278944 RepID=A0A4Z1H4Y5_9HELO|nr:hypothetical protein BOTNAR_1255g00010 [Botryotinia narcissicola]
MRDIANLPGYAADTNDRVWQSSEHGETETGTAIMALVSICSNLVAELLARLMNDDDLGFPPEIAFTTAGLDAWTKLPNNEMSFIFDGG